MTTNNRKGFTLAELLIVVAIIGVLVAVSIPIFTGQLSKARAATDQANVRSAKAAALAEYMTGEQSADTVYYYDAAKGTITTDATAAASITGYGKSTVDLPNGDLPDDNATGIPKGHIVAITVTKDGTSTAAWTLGTGSGTGTEGSGTGGIVPGTNLQTVSSYWPEQSEYDDNQYGNKTVNAGGIFKYTDGSYYVVTKTISITKSQAESGPGGVTNNWYDVQKITGRVLQTSDFNGAQKKDLARGDICQVGDDYYVYVDGGTWAFAPNNSSGASSQWYKIPSE